MMENKILLSMEQLDSVTGGSGQGEEKKVIYLVSYYKENGDLKEYEFDTEEEARTTVERLHSVGITGVGVTRCEL